MVIRGRVSVGLPSRGVRRDLSTGSHRTSRCFLDPDLEASFSRRHGGAVPHADLDNIYSVTAAYAGWGILNIEVVYMARGHITVVASDIVWRYFVHAGEVVGCASCAADLGYESIIITSGVRV